MKASMEFPSIMGIVTINSRGLPSIMGIVTINRREFPSIIVNVTFIAGLVATCMKARRHIKQQLNTGSVVCCVAVYLRRIFIPRMK